MTAPGAAFCPATPAELAEFLAGYEGEGRIKPVGASSNPFPLFPGDAAVSLERFDWIDHRREDLTVAAGAGVDFAALQARLREVNQRIALDPPAGGTVGAMVATSAHGYLAHRYGGVRDLVIGTTMVLGDGAIAHSGGRVIKNVAGYDLTKALVGSRGTVAAIVEVVFRTHPLPEFEAMAAFPVLPERVPGFLGQLYGLRVDPVGIEWSADTAYAIFEGTKEGVESQLRTLTHHFGRDAVYSGDAFSELISEVRAIQVPKDREVTVRLCGRAARGAELFELANRAERVSAHAGMGIVDAVYGDLAVSKLEELLLAAEERGVMAEVRAAGKDAGEAVQAAGSARLVSGFSGRVRIELDPKRRFWRGR